VKGKFEIFAFKRVAALKKVVLPAFVFPIKPMVNKEKSLNINYYLQRYKTNPKCEKKLSCQQESLIVKYNPCRQTTNLFNKHGLHKLSTKPTKTNVLFIIN
jgi:hypothetical protein